MESAWEEEEGQRQERRMEEQECARMEVAEAEFCCSELNAREQKWARHARVESLLSWRQLAEYEVDSANAELEDLQECRLQQQEEASRRHGNLDGLPLETSLLERHVVQAHHSQRALDATASLREAQGRDRLERQLKAEQETVRQENSRHEAMLRQMVAQQEAAADLADGIEEERVRELYVRNLHTSAEELRRQSAYNLCEPILQNTQLDEEAKMWDKHCRSLNAESELLRQQSLKLRAQTESLEQEALQTALQKLIERQMEQQRLIAEKGEKERRKQWMQLQAINAALGSLHMAHTRRKNLPSSEAQTEAGRAQSTKEEDKAESVRHMLRAMGLDNADDEQLRHEQRCRVVMLAKSEARLAASLSYSREQWLDDAAFLRDIFLRSTRVSTLMRYVDEQGCPRVASPRQKKESLKKPTAVDGVLAEGCSNDDVQLWASAMVSRIALLREYVAEESEVCQEWGFYSADETLLPSISQLHVRVEILNALARAQKDLTQVGGVGAAQTQTASASESQRSKPPTSEDTQARMVDGCEVVTTRITYVEAVPGAISPQERARMEAQVQQCESDAAELRAHVALMRQHVLDLKIEEQATRADQE